MGRWVHSSRPRTARVTADAGRDARVADGRAGEPSCGLPGLYNDVVHAPLCFATTSGGARETDSGRWSRPRGREYLTIVGDTRVVARW